MTSFMSVLSCLFFKAMLDFVYIEHIAPKFAYAGLSYYAAPALIIVLSYLLIIPFAYACTKLPNQPSKLVITLLFLFSFIPACTLMAFGGFEVTPIFLLSIGFATLIFCTKIRNPILQRLQLTTSYNPIVFLIVSVYIIGLVWLIIQYGIKIPTSLLDVYGQRAAYKESLSTGWGMTAYMLSWLGSVVIPFLLIYAIIRKQYWAAGIALVGLLEIFGVAGNKSYLFSFLIIIGVYVGTIRYSNKELLYYSSGLTFIVFLSFMLDRFFSTITFSSLFARRLLFLPAQLYYDYYDFFSNSEFTMLSQSILSWLVKYPYPAPIPQMIGKYYYHSYDTNANANFFGDAYANFGIPGIVIFSAILAVILTSINNIAHNKDQRIVYAMLAMPCISLSNSALFTSLLTHGIALVFLTMLLMPRASEQTDAAIF